MKAVFGNSGDDEIVVAHVQERREEVEGETEERSRRGFVRRWLFKDSGCSFYRRDVRLHQVCIPLGSFSRIRDVPAPVLPF